MAEGSTSRRVTRGITSHTHNFEDGPSFDLCITQKGVNVGKRNNVVNVQPSKDKGAKEKVKYFCKNPPIKSSHMCCYANKKIVRDLTKYLTSQQLKAFCKTCFGIFLDMSRCTVQANMFRCFMVHELSQDTSEEIMIHINDTTLNFTLKEFATVSGLKCV
ncbi:hypothetical protein HAX54_040511, partial [Datura stramonium]|nr:hypothetical protein [Datura stramonium]